MFTFPITVKISDGDAVPIPTNLPISFGKILFPLAFHNEMELFTAALMLPFSSRVTLR